jgi:folate-dependent phosphoribosylglycinamide formyltransferase PurN
VAEDGASPFKVIFIYSDRSDGKSAGESIALENGIPYFSYDIRAFHRRRSLKRTVCNSEGLAARSAYDQVAKRLVEAFEIDVIALGGYMSYTTIDRCINVHPADLSILTPQGRRKYVGDNAVFDAIAGGETTLRASTLWTDQGVDTGPLLMVSEPLPVELPEPLESMLRDQMRLQQIADDHQERLKVIGDWEIFPRTIEMIARGRFGFNESKQPHVDGCPVPRGYRL